MRLAQLTLLFLGVAAPAFAQEPAANLKQAVIFRASFDESTKADVAGGQATLNTRSNHPTQMGQFVFEKGYNDKVFRIAKDRGISGGALEAVDVLPNNGRIFYPGSGNVPFNAKGWSGAVSVWCKLDPNKQLKTKFCDPIQITHKGAGNGGLWFDFNDAKPRDLRHGAFSAVPAGQKAISEDDPKAPMVRVPKIDWKDTDWHHVVLNCSGFDTGKNATSQLYIDGKLIGTVRDRPIAMEWDPEQVGIYVAINYIGLLDELTLFRRSLTDAEIQQLHAKPALVK